MKKILSVIALSFTLLQVAEAGRYYDPDNGRFMSRDKKGYVDGMSLYAGYFASNFSLDPMGEKMKIAHIEITAKSFIDGSLMPAINRKKPRNWTLKQWGRLLAYKAATILNFKDENPTDGNFNKVKPDSRLTSFTKLQVTYDDGKIYDINEVTKVEAFMGLEPGILARGVIRPTKTFKPTIIPQWGLLELEWRSEGTAAQIGINFQNAAIKLGVGEIIWHRPRVTLDFTRGTPTVKTRLRGSKFPSHKLFTRITVFEGCWGMLPSSVLTAGVWIEREHKPQKHISYLWETYKKNPKKILGH